MKVFRVNPKNNNPKFWNTVQDKAAKGCPVALRVVEPNTDVITLSDKDENVIKAWEGFVDQGEPALS